MKILSSQNLRSFVIQRMSNTENEVWRSFAHRLFSDLMLEYETNILIEIYIYIYILLSI